MATQSNNPLYGRIRDILESARIGVARSVNTTQVLANWLIGREIVEEEQRGKDRADYGARLIAELSEKLLADYGRGYAARNLASFREFYRTYPRLLEISHAVRATLGLPFLEADNRGILHAPRAKSGSEREESWLPGRFNPNLSWTHYRALLRAGHPQSRAFYEIESIKNNWSARELERQINSLLFERLAKSRDKAGLLRLAAKGQEIQKAVDVFKDPMVIEFLGLPESPRLVESKLEEALITNLQLFLLELGKGFAFISRQERLTLDSDHFYIDLVFYHAVLKCYILIDLKVGKLTHADLGQIQLYVNYYDRQRRTEGDNPTLGLVLCTDKNDAVVKYTLGQDQERKIFASQYKLHLPTEAELKAEIRKELKQLKNA